MFLFGSGPDGRQQADGSAPLGTLAERDQEIADLEAQIVALRDASKADMDEFEDAISAKNKALEEQGRELAELREQNKLLEDKLRSGEGGGGTASAEAHAPETQEGGGSSSEAVSALEAQRASLEAELERTKQELAHAGAQLMAYNDAFQTQALQLEEAGKAMQENLELRRRLEEAIAAAVTAKRSADGDAGVPVDTLEERVLVMEPGQQLGAMFGPQEARGMGHGWPIVRVRDGSWAEQQGLQPNDELHKIAGQVIEVLPEEEVMQLLAQRPLEMTWVHRTPGQPKEANDVPSQAVGDSAPQAPFTIPPDAQEEVQEAFDISTPPGEREAEEECTSLQQKREALTAEVTHLEAQVDRLRKEVELVSQEAVLPGLEESQTELADLRARCVQQQDEVLHAKAEAQRLEAELAAAQAAVQAASTANPEAPAQDPGELDRLRAEVDSLLSERQQGLESLREVQQMHEVAKQEVADAQAEVECLTATLQQQGAMKAEAEQLNTQLQEQVHSLQVHLQSVATSPPPQDADQNAELDAAKAEVQRLTQELHSHSSAAAEAQLQVDSLRAKGAEQDGTNQHLSEQVQRLTEELQTCRHAAEQAEAASAEAASVKVEAANLLERVREQEAASTNLKEEVNALQIELSQKSAELDALNARVANSNGNVLLKEDGIVANGKHQALKTEGEDTGGWDLGDLTLDDQPSGNTQVPDAAPTEWDLDLDVTGTEAPGAPGAALPGATTEQVAAPSAKEVELSAEVVRLQASSAEQQQKIAEMEAEVRQAHESSTAAQAAVLQAREESEALRAAVVAAKEEAQSTGNEAGLAATELENARAQVATLQAQLQTATASSQASSEEVAGLNAELADVREHLLQTAEQLEKQAALTQDLQSQMADMKAGQPAESNPDEVQPPQGSGLAEGGADAQGWGFDELDLDVPGDLGSTSIKQDADLPSPEAEEARAELQKEVLTLSEALKESQRHLEEERSRSTQLQQRQDAQVQQLQAADMEVQRLLSEVQALQAAAAVTGVTSGTSAAPQEGDDFAGWDIDDGVSGQPSEEAKLQQEIEGLRTELEAGMKVCAEDRRLLELAQQARDEALASAASSSQALAEAQLAATAARTEADEHRSAAQEAKARAEEAEAAEAAQSQHALASQEALAALQHEHQQLLSSSKSEVSRLEQEAAASKGQAEALQRQLEEVQSEVAHMRSEAAENLGGCKEQHSAEVAALTQEIASLQAQVERLLSKPDQLPAGVEKTEGDDSAWDFGDEGTDTAGVAAPGSKVADLEAKLERMEQEAQDNRRQLDASAEQEKRLAEEVADLEKSLQDSQEETANLLRQVADLQASQSTTVEPSASGTSGGDNQAAMVELQSSLDEQRVRCQEAVKQADTLRLELAASKGRLTHCEDTLKAERAAHSEAVVTSLRVEIANLSQDLVVERQDRESAESQLRALLQQAQEEVRRRGAASNSGAEASPATADNQALQEEVASLQRQRNEAQSIAQRVARQSAALADELHRLRMMQGSSQASTSRPVQPANDPERTLHQAEHNPTDPEQANPEASNARGDHHTGTQQDGAAEVIAPEAAIDDEILHHDEGADWNEDLAAAAASPQRPPDEVTSGWDVFDPDTQLEHTVPVAAAGNTDWDTGDAAELDELFEAFNSPTEPSSNSARPQTARPAVAPELSPDVPAGDAISGAVADPELEELFNGFGDMP